MEGRALTAPPIVLTILAAIALTSRLSVLRLRTMAGIHRKSVPTPRPLVPIPLPIGAIPRRADRIQRPRAATPRRANRIPRPNAATPRRAVRIQRPSVATLHPLPPAVLTRPRATVQVAVVAGHRTAVAGVGHIDRKFDAIY